MVMAVGSWRTAVGFNIPAFTFPIRFSHNSDMPGGEPGYATDNYYTTLMTFDQVSGWVFDSWDSNGNNRFGENDAQGFDTFDWMPEISFGRLACTNVKEVNTLVDKIIFYETHNYINDSWFNKIVTVTGDGFQDINYAPITGTDTRVDWNTNSVPDGDYTIYAQSWLQSDHNVKGPIDAIKVTVDHNAPSMPSNGHWFLEDDHLHIVPLNPEQPEVYPGKPVAEIVVPGIPGVVLGNTNKDYNPPNAYISDSSDWGRVTYQNHVLTIKTKSYDPSEKGNHPSLTQIKIWINDSTGKTIFGNATNLVIKDSTVWYEGEVECGHALDTMVPDVYHGNVFTKIHDWTSNGRFMRMLQILADISDGCGFLYFSGHSSPMAWGDHYPGIPGGRANGMVNAIATINTKYGLERYAAAQGDPLFPIDQLTNGHKLPVWFNSGCHSGCFDTSLISALSDPQNVLFGTRYGTWSPEGMSWWMVRQPQGGSIATFGNTGLGYGYLGSQGPFGLTGYMFGHCLYHYFNADSQLRNNTQFLGPLHRVTLIDYATNIGGVPLDTTERKTWEEFDLLGDPSLKVGGYGGYPSSTGLGTTAVLNVTIDPIALDSSQKIVKTVLRNTADYTNELTWSIRITGESPLGRFLFLTPGSIGYNLLLGRIFGGGVTSGTIALSPGESVNISSNPTMGFGWIMVNVSIHYGDPKLLVDRTEDGFLLGNRLLLYYGEE
jgi:hypothetical protein